MQMAKNSISDNDAQLSGLANLAGQGALSRQPDNENFLLQDRFFFQMPRIPKFTYFVQSVSIPPYQYSSVEQPTRFVPIKRPGKNITFDELSVQFLLDEDLQTYFELYNWMNTLQTVADYDDIAEIEKQYGFASCMVLNSAMKPQFQFKFYNLFPTSLGGFEFNSAITDQEGILTEATFSYSHFELESL